MKNNENKEITTMSKLNEMNEKIAEGVQKGYKNIETGVVEGYKKIEDGVVGGYKKIEEKFSSAFLNEDGSLKSGKMSEAVAGAYQKVESGIVDGFNKVTDKCVEKLFAKEGESVEDAKKRLAGEKKEEE